VPASTTRLDPGYDALSNGVAILDRSHLGRVRITGADALDLINRFSTNETVGLADGDVVVTVLTSNIGRVIELITVVRRSATESVILTGPGAENTIVEWLDRYNFGEDCEFSITTESSAQISVSGPHASELGLPLPENGRAISTEIGGVAVEIVHVPGPSLASYEVLVEDRNALPAVSDALAAAGGVPADENATEALRIERGLPARSHEITDDNNPLEAGLEPYVSFTKGCYMGQEVIARLDTYDKIQRRIVGLLSSDNAKLSTESTLRSEDREIGRITSVAASPSLGREIALAYVRKAFAEPGTLLSSDNGTVEVVALPFVTGPGL
jgi:tRNA-modifying protein YgfZ